RKGSADQWSDHRNPGVTPIRVALSRNREKEVRDARPKIASRVDRVTRCPTERETDDQDQQGNRQRAEGRQTGLAVIGEREDHEDQDERPEYLADEVRGVVANRGTRAED